VTEAACGDAVIDPPEECDIAMANPDDPCPLGKVCANEYKRVCAWRLKVPAVLRAAPGPAQHGLHRL